MNEQLYRLKEEMFLQDIKESMRRHGIYFALIGFGTGDDETGYISSHVLSYEIDEEFEDGLIKMGHQLAKKIVQLNKSIKS